MTPFEQALAAAQARHLIDAAVHEAQRKSAARAELLSRRCPTCGALPGKPCRRRSGLADSYYLHVARTRPAHDNVK